MSVPTAALRPVTLLIGALGGEGGGVLSNWIVNAAQSSGLPVQATSIPGVAQRTGATTYYVEIWPQPLGASNGRAPLLALSPAVGEVDVMAVTELLEAGRAIRNGFVTPDRTLLIASTHRVYTTTEKIVMDDGRFDPAQLRKAAEASAQTALLLDLNRIAQGAQAPVNAVLLGVIAGTGRLPLAPDAFRRGIQAEGKAAEANLRGFEAGLAVAQGQSVALAAAVGQRPDPAVDAAALRERVASRFPAALQETLRHAVPRLIDFQDAPYAALYLDRLEPFLRADAALLEAVARHLAVRMSYDDAIRVAQAKIRPERLERIRAETGAAPDDPVIVTEFLKPGLEEICDILPEPIARVLLGLGRRWPRLALMRKGLHVKSTSLLGYGQLRLLAGLRRWRRGTWRFRREEESIGAWLDLVRSGAARDPRLAWEIAECARLIKGYGETYHRGVGNYRRIEAALIRPALETGSDAVAAAALIAQARAAALADPEGAALDKLLAQSAGGSGVGLTDSSCAYRVASPRESHLQSLMERLS